jgi:hypothetical protein
MSQPRRFGAGQCLFLVKPSGCPADFILKVALQWSGFASLPFFANNHGIGTLEAR